MKRLLREPLLHFLLIGALLFAVNHYFGGQAPGRPNPERVIRVTAADANHLSASFERLWQRPPTPQEWSTLLDDYVAEEVYYREALRLGLDRDDTVIRKRLRQKVEFLSEDLVAVEDPAESQLQQYLAAHPEDFWIEPRYTLSQVYLNPDQRGASLTNDAARLLQELNAPTAPPDLSAVGDRLMIDVLLEDYSESDVGRLFGKEFALNLAALPSGRWVGPVQSGYGAHLVRVESRTPGRLPELEEVRTKVICAWTKAQREQANTAFYQSLRSQYEVVLDPAITNAPAEARQEERP
jgi:hypothetical protein